MGKIHLELISKMKGVEAVGFYDSSRARSKKVAEELGLRSFSSAEALINASEAVVIVTPSVSHYDYAVMTLRKCKHVFIEKPVTNTLAEAKTLVELAREADVKVQVGHVERFNPAFIAAKPFCTEPMFIEAHRLAQFNPRGTDVSVVLDLMIHDIDIVLSLVQANVKKISASGVAVVSDTPDIANARIEFNNGCVANLTASRISLKNMRKMRLFQRDAYISIDFYEKKTEIVKLKTVEGKSKPSDMVIDLGKDKGRKQIYFESPEIAEINSIQEELESFGRCIAENTTPLVTIRDGYDAMDIAYRIIEKLKLSPNLMEV